MPLPEPEVSPSSTVTRLTELEAALEKLEAQGARHFDCEACDCIRGLLTSAENLGGGAGERLARRAAVHLASLEQQVSSERGRALEWIDQVEGGGARQLLQQRVEQGQSVYVLRSLRRLRARAKLSGAKTRQAVQAETTQAQEDASSRSRRCAQAYEDSLADLVASFALARAVDTVPEGSGPYNSLRIASELLDGMRTVSPRYLTVQVNRLEELASLLTLPELPEPPKPVSGKGKSLPKPRKSRTPRGA